jgi:RsiW-degrading membrane proteinase PrsW (M82 family)
VGIVEEFFKYLAVRVTVYRSKEFNEVMDGMIYMVSAALGFAATENVGYMLGFGFAVGFLRAILSYLAHISFSAILGYYMGRAKIEGQKNLIWVGFGLAICLHWLYDAFLVAGTLKSSGGFLLLGLMIWVFGLILSLTLFKKAQAVSPFRTTHILPKRLTKPCQACGKTVSAKAPLCHHCGESLPLDEEEVTLKV